MIFLFLHWLMAEEKNCIVPGERTMSRQGPWFYAVAAIILFLICYAAAQINALLAVATVGGSAIFFIMQGFRLFADKKSAELEAGTSTNSDISKLMLLEVIDATFSIDGVIGAFAFTMSVPLILIGNGIGAVIVRELTVRNIDRQHQKIRLSQERRDVLNLYPRTYHVRRRIRAGHPHLVCTAPDHRHSGNILLALTAENQKRRLRRLPDPAGVTRLSFFSSRKL